MIYLYGVLAILGAWAALVVLCWIVIQEEKQSVDENYDERQIQAQGNAYRLSFYVSLCYYLGLLFFGGLLESREAVYLALVIGVVLQMMVYHIYCLLTHAALSVSGKPLTAVFFYGAAAVLNFAHFAMMVFQDGCYAEYASGNVWVRLITAMSFGALSLMHLIQYFRDKRESHE